MQDIEVPLLSVANWGGILLHLRGNIQGYMNAGSKKKYLRIITGRHDLPFYSKESAALQESFLKAFLKGEDDEGWSTGKMPKIGLVLRKGDVGYNNPEAEKSYPYRYEREWPIPRMNYVKYYLTSKGVLSRDEPASTEPPKTMAYEALGNLKAPQFVQFSTERFEQELEFTGHFVAHLNISATRHRSDAKDQADFMDLDLFLTIRHISGNNTEILYTGTVGDPVPVTKGWLRASLRKTNLKSSRHQHWHPHREHVSTDGDLLSPGQVYEVDVEIWPSNVIVDKGARLVFEVSSGDTQGAGLFEHNSLDDRPAKIFAGRKHIHFGDGIANWLLLPEIPRTIEPQPYATN